MVICEFEKHAFLSNFLLQLNYLLFSNSLLLLNISCDAKNFSQKQDKLILVRTAEAHLSPKGVLRYLKVLLENGLRLYLNTFSANFILICSIWLQLIL